MAKKKELDLETEQLPTTKAKRAAAPKEPKEPKAVKEVPPAQEIRGAVTTFQTELVDFEKETFPHCKIKYLAKPKQPLWEKARKQALKKISKDISIPGFRKGKAPLNIILQKYGTQIEKQTENEVADICFEECQKVGKTPILHNHNNVSFHIDGKESTDPTFVFSFDAEPALPKLDYSKFQLKAIPAVVVDEKQIAEELDQIRGFYATWEQIHDRAVEMGDFVVLNIDDMDQEHPSQVFNEARFEVTEEKMAVWMRDLVVGKNIGETVLGVSKPDLSASEEDKNTFKEKKVRITIVSIEKSTLPEIDDTLAMKLGAKDLVALKTTLQHLVESKALRASMEELRHDIEQQMIDKIIFDVPAILLEQEANHRMSQLFNNANFKKKWSEELTDEEKEKKKAEIKEKSTQAIRLFYLCREIVNSNRISVGPSDMDSSFDSLLEMMYGDQTKLQYKSMTEDQKQMALTTVMMHKAQDHIIHQLQKSNSGQENHV